MDARDEFLEIFYDNVDREGADKFLEWLEKSDFFTAPASTRRHNSFKGGLCAHSVNVYKRFVKLIEGQFGENWQEDKQQHLMELKQAADFCGEVSRQPYSSPQQLKNYQTFMLSHTEGATLIYDPDYPGKSKYDHQSILKRQAKTTYGEELIDMFELQDAATEMAEQSANDQE